LLIVGLITPIILFIIGYFIRFKKASFLISGYNTSSKSKKEKYNEAALCKAVGNLLFLLSFIQLIIPIGGSLFPDKLKFFAIFTTILTIVITIIAVIYMNTGNRYKS
jgi:NADH:ubiquinone oxidoreductase subunit 5 (subunit L)/multisubunit Na+/H+ antiporter MnhA subunit